MRKYAKTNKELQAIKRRASFYMELFPDASNQKVAEWLSVEVAQCYNKGSKGRRALIELVRSVRPPKKTFWQKIKQIIGL